MAKIIGACASTLMLLKTINTNMIQTFFCLLINLEGVIHNLIQCHLAHHDSFCCSLAVCLRKLISTFRISKTVHHDTFKRINQPDAAISQVYYLSLNTAQHVSGTHMPIIRSSTTAVAASGLPLQRGGSSAVTRGRSGSDRPRPTTLLPPRSNGKPVAVTAVVEFLMMGMRMPETC